MTDWWHEAEENDYDREEDDWWHEAEENDYDREEDDD